mmetsp:Transcript_1014/g.2791  ORF Transcript_1014/g.2791 Transcript_1014/m.2791 type:complete len:490 (+) Transcript_1014:492-1961(+)
MRNMGILQSTTMVWRQGMDEWKTLYQVEELSELAHSVFGQWHYSTGKVRLGPVSFQKIGELLKNGTVTSATLVWCPHVTKGGWRAVAEVESLQSFLEDVAASNMQELLPGDADAEGADAKPAKKGKGKDSGEGKAKAAATPQDEGLQELFDLADAVKSTSPTPEESRNGGSMSPPPPDAAKAGNGAAANGKGNGNANGAKKKKRKRAWAKTSSWIYVEGLPADITVEELKEHFGKTGVIAMDPRTGGPKIKIYRDADGNPKGDGSVCYASAASVPLAVDVFDGGPIRYGINLKVSVATFEKKEGYENKQPRLTAAQLKVAKAAAKQKLAWNDEDDAGLAMKAMRICVVSNLFDLEDFRSNPNFRDELEREIVSACEPIGPIEKMTLFSKNPKGVVIIKFVTAYAAEEAIRVLHGHMFRGQRKISCIYWDGVTDYTVVDEAQETKRDEDFGKWLEDQSVPEDLAPKTEEDGAGREDDSGLPPELRLQYEE